MQKFTFGGNSEWTAEDIKRKREIANMLMRQIGTPRNVGEGLSALGKALAVRGINKKADARDAELRSEFNDEFADVAPNTQGLIDLMNSPYASKAHKSVVEALMKGVPNYKRGTRNARGGLAVVGEDGPEVIKIPGGSQVIPMTPQYDIREQKHTPVPEWDEDFDPRELTPKEESSFQPGAEFKTAQAGPIDLSQSPATGSDTVQSRRRQDAEIGQRNALNGLSGILEELQANPELLDSAHTLTGRSKTALLRLRDRMGVEAWDIGPEDEESLANTTAYKQQLLTQVNNYIKEITGATVGQGDETKRLMAVQANESDSPTQVVAKITNALNIGRLEVARQMYMQREGGEAPTDRDLREILRSRGRALYDSAIASGASPADARIKAAAALSKEFGL